MSHRSILAGAFLVAAISCPASAYMGMGQSVDADDNIDEVSSKLVSKMLADIGGHNNIKKSNGKRIACKYRGSKKVTIITKGEETTYTGEYLNCIEDQSVRDGIYSVKVVGDIIVDSTSRLSVNEELLEASRAGDIKKIKKLIKKKADVNYTNSVLTTDNYYIHEFSSLMRAVTSRNLDAVKLLVSAGAWVNYLNSQSFNALRLAVDIGRIDMVKYLVEQGAYINNSNYEGVTPLMAAAANGNYEIAEYLINRHADINCKHNDGDSALMLALGRGHSKIAALLIDSGADVNIQNKYGVSALLIAAAEGNIGIAQKLIACKADIRAKSDTGKTALEVAEAKGHKEIAEMLKKAIN